METPEINKMLMVQPESQAIGQFLEWLGTKGYAIGKYETVEGYLSEQFVPDLRPINQMLAEYYEIDLTKVDTEQRAILEALRQATTTD